MTPDAIIFDMDGTLIDSERIWDKVRRGLAADEGLAWTEENTLAMMGMSTPEWSGYLVDEVGLSGTPEQAAERTIAGLTEAYTHEVPLLPGALESVRRMHAIAPLAVASSSPRVLIEAVLDSLGIADLFAVTVSTEEVAAGKPAPDGFLEAARRLGADPARTVAIEDSTSGIKAGHAAGMKVVAVPEEFRPAKPEALALADVVIDSLDDLTADLIASL